MIVDSYAYEAAIARRIAKNREIGRQRKFSAWMAADATRKELVDAIYSKGEKSSGFFRNMMEAIQQFGSLTEKQEAVCRRIINENKEKIAAARAVDSKSSHIGTVGKREVFTAHVRNVVTFEGDYGRVYIHLMADASGNVIVYKGSKIIGRKGETIEFLATVKDHGTRDGIKQTIVSRPANEKVIQAAEVFAA